MLMSMPIVQVLVFMHMCAVGVLLELMAVLHTGSCDWLSRCACLTVQYHTAERAGAQAVCQ